LRTIATKVNDEFYNEIKKMADDNNITISKLLKKALKKITNDDIKNIDETIKTKTETNKRIVYELNRLGQNLNQIAKHCNSKKIVDKLVLEELIKIEKELQGLTNDM
jgi:hypothetical protein